MGQCQSSATQDVQHEQSLNLTSTPVALGHAKEHTKRRNSAARRQSTATEGTVNLVDFSDDFQVSSSTSPNLVGSDSSNSSSSAHQGQPEEAPSNSKKTPTVDNLKDLTASAHRRVTLEFQAARRLQLEKDASDRLEKKQSESQISWTRNSRPALRMPHRDGGAAAAERRQSFMRENSWFSLCLSDSDLSFEDYSASGQPEEDASKNEQYVDDDTNSARQPEESELLEG